MSSSDELFPSAPSAAGSVGESSSVRGGVGSLKKEKSSVERRSSSALEKDSKASRSGLAFSSMFRRNRSRTLVVEDVIRLVECSAFPYGIL